jgi:transposase
MRTITLNATQQRRAEILTRLDAGALDVATAGEMLGLSDRQVRRLLARFRKEGMAAVIHGNAGRKPANCIPLDVAEQIATLAGPQGKYHDLNVCHLQELLEKEEHIVVGRSTLDRLLKQVGVRAPAKRVRPIHRRRRERCPAEGMLLQIDGSPFNWLEERGSKAVLMGAIDDATGKVLFLHFRPTEDQIGYLLLMRDIACRFGLPMSLYHDRHTILRSPKVPTLEEQLAGQTPMSQLQRIMAELGIESIAAYSPQAKGRIERLWKTLQDRLTKELRLADVGTLTDANAFLPAFMDRYNARFAKEPKDPCASWVPLPAGLDIPYYFSIRETRKVRADHCIRFNGQTVQLLPSPSDPCLVGQTVTVHVVPEGDLYLYYGKRCIAHQLAEAPSAEPLQPATHKTRPAAEPAPSNGKARQRAWLYGKR